MKKFFYNTPAFRYIFEIVVIVFSVTLSFYIQDVLNDREKIEEKKILLSLHNEISNNLESLKVVIK